MNVWESSNSQFMCSARSYAFNNIFFVVSSQKAVTKYKADLTNRVVVDEEVSLRRIPSSPQLKSSQTRHWVFWLREVNYSLMIEPYICRGKFLLLPFDLKTSSNTIQTLPSQQQPFFWWSQQLLIIMLSPDSKIFVVLLWMRATCKKR